MKVISILNPKGGAGKTVSSVNIAYALIRKGKKVLSNGICFRKTIRRLLILDDYCKTETIEKLIISLLIILKL